MRLGIALKDMLTNLNFILESTASPFRRLRREEHCVAGWVPWAVSSETEMYMHRDYWRLLEGCVHGGEKEAAFTRGRSWAGMSMP